MQENLQHYFDLNVPVILQAGIIIVCFILQTIAVDTSGRFIDACMTLQENKSVPFYCSQVKGAKRGKVEACIGTDADMGSVVFKQVGMIKVFHFMSQLVAQQLVHMEECLFI